MDRNYLKEGEYVGHEVYFPGDDPPQEVIDKLISNGFCKSNDGFYIPEEALELFKMIAHPYKVDIMQGYIILGGVSFTEQMTQLLDMVNQLKAAGVHGVDNYIEKITKAF